MPLKAYGVSFVRTCGGRISVGLWPVSRSVSSLGGCSSSRIPLRGIPSAPRNDPPVPGT
jgi:hypothetical protein